MNERIRQIRKSLHLTQKDFGAKLGVSRDVISNIEYDRVEPKKVFLELLCNLFNVNNKWLETGEGDMFLKENKTQKNLIEAQKIFTELSPELQDYALEQIKGLLKIQNSKKQE